MNKTTLAASLIKSKFFSGIPVLILFLSIVSCSNSLEKKLVGTWKGSDYFFQRTAGPNMVVTVGGGLEQHLNSSLILNEDGTYKKLVSKYDNGSGTWELDDDKLITRDKSGNELTYTLIKVTDSELVTIQDVDMEIPSGEEIVGKITLSYSRDLK